MEQMRTVVHIIRKSAGLEADLANIRQISWLDSSCKHRIVIRWNNKETNRDREITYANDDPPENATEQHVNSKLRHRRITTKNE